MLRENDAGAMLDVLSRLARKVELMIGNVTNYRMDIEGTDPWVPLEGDEWAITSPKGRSRRGFVCLSARKMERTTMPNRWVLRLKEVPIGQLERPLEAQTYSK